MSSYVKSATDVRLTGDWTFRDRSHVPVSSNLAKDFDVRNWNYPTRAAMVSYHHRAREAEVEIGYLLEGKACTCGNVTHLSGLNCIVALLSLSLLFYTC